MENEGKLALVTGASRGIGAAIAAELVDSGAMVVGTATSESGAAAISGALKQRAEDLGVASENSGRVLDVCDPESIAALMADLPQPPAILVNNAGITRDQLLLRMSEDDWDDIMATNLKSVFRLSKVCMRGMMKARFGRIINIASVIGLVGNPGQANYAAAKAGIIAFTKSLAREVGSRGITANTVAPGFIDTDMTRSLPEAQREALLGQIPLNRLGEGEDIAAAVRYLASPGAAYVTGETLHVNGGMYMS
ncbi:MAG: 3-oxoacyl-ACP reductase FabG [Lysobacterales bacterium]